MKTNNQGDDFQVGYGKPPRQERFQKGQSGNRKGRPKGSKNSATILKKALLATVPAREDGRQRNVTKLEAIIKRLVGNAVRGDYRSIALLLDRMSGLDLSESMEPRTVTSKELDEMYRRLYESFIRKEPL